MGSSPGFWTDPDDDRAAARFAAEHGSVGRLDGDVFTVETGSEAMLPPWPPAGHDTIPCPTCWLPADLIAPSAIDVLHHSRCPAGHDNALAPAVLEHLRSLEET